MSQRFRCQIAIRKGTPNSERFRKTGSFVGLRIQLRGGVEVLQITLAKNPNQ